MGIFNDKYILPVRKPITAPTTIPRLKKSIYKRNLYGRVWGLARKATLLAVEQEDNEIVTYLQGYISQKRNGSTVDEIFNNAWESQTNKSSDQSQTSQTNQSSDQSEESDESEAEQNKDIIETNFKNVRNPNKVSTRGRPSKRRYISSVKKEQGYREDLAVEGLINVVFATKWNTMQLFIKIERGKKMISSNSV
ncbi:hypothetical protein C2G38_2039848 [Gigaspora rosea]|uniref:Uncharacterized protein n=1 Tax=Gigaspora rosea TaxID=44941 RepID=A0A397UZR5_9GLOM|nr:hypothetical protein C2G38_2039848 [Gigaspora rosea]